MCINDREESYFKQRIKELLNILRRESLQQSVKFINQLRNKT